MSILHIDFDAKDRAAIHLHDPDEKKRKKKPHELRLDDGATSKNVVFLSWSDGKVVGIARVYIYIHIYIYIFECMWMDFTRHPFSIYVLRNIGAWNEPQKKRTKQQVGFANYKYTI